LDDYNIAEIRILPLKKKHDSLENVQLKAEEFPVMERTDLDSENAVVAIVLTISDNMNRPMKMATRQKSIVKAAALLPIGRIRCVRCEGVMQGSESNQQRQGCEGIVCYHWAQVSVT
jgi:hypothetical protein